MAGTKLPDHPAKGKDKLRELSEYLPAPLPETIRELASIMTEEIGWCRPEYVNIISFLCNNQPLPLGGEGQSPPSVSHPSPGRHLKSGMCHPRRFRHDRL